MVKIYKLVDQFYVACVTGILFFSELISSWMKRIDFDLVGGLRANAIDRGVTQGPTIIKMNHVKFHF